MQSVSVPWMIATALALGLTVASLYFQWLRARGPKIRLLNDGDEQRSVLRSYDGLPSALQQHFPRYQDRYPGHAIVRLVFGNEGNHSGYAKICDVTMDAASHAGWSAAEEIAVSRYEYALVAARSVSDHVLLLRNVRPIDGDKRITLTIKLRTGGTVGLRAKIWQSPESIHIVKVLLKPSVF